MEHEELAAQLRALADPIRLAIVSRLPASDECPHVYNVTELAEEIGLAQPTVSHHLRLLKQAGLVRCRKMCRDVYYWVDAQALKQVLDRTVRLVPSQPPVTTSRQRQSHQEGPAVSPRTRSR
jgi:ArsR family transcriptional regulator, arsenate/arsenite/antimonite-responsive transcriptional repressor